MALEINSCSSAPCEIVSRNYKICLLKTRYTSWLLISSPVLHSTSTAKMEMGNLSLASRRFCNNAHSQKTSILSFNSSLLNIVVS